MLDGAVSLAANRLERFRRMFVNCGVAMSEAEAAQAMQHYRRAYEAQRRAVPGVMALLAHLHPRLRKRRILDAIAQQLPNEPLTATRHRKPLRPNDLSAWELRVGTYRIFYDVEEERATVRVKAIGWKEHNRLFIRGKEYLLENH